MGGGEVTVTGGGKKQHRFPPRQNKTKKVGLNKVPRPTLGFRKIFKTGGQKRTNPVGTKTYPQGESLRVPQKKPSTTVRGSVTLKPGKITPPLRKPHRSEPTRPIAKKSNALKQHKKRFGKGEKCLNGTPGV